VEILNGCIGVRFSNEYSSGKSGLNKTEAVYSSVFNPLRGKISLAFIIRRINVTGK